jgi:hypothetical protein
MIERSPPDGPALHVAQPLGLSALARWFPVVDHLAVVG